MHSLPLFGIGIFLALAGAGLAALTLRKAPTSAAPVKKADLRAQAVEQQNALKLRIAGAVSVVIGVVLMVLS